MKFTPKHEDQDFNDWYKEFHLLFEDSYGDEEEVMDIALSCWQTARAPLNAILDSFEVQS